MKKIVLAMMMSVLALTVNAKGKQPIAFENIPQPVQEAFQKTFTTDQVQYITFEKALGQQLYTFILSEGTKIKFNHKAVLCKVENKNGIVLSLIPEKILEYAQTTFPNATITEYVFTKGYKEIELNNNVDLIFNKRDKFLRIED